jgi:hypothetical protein
VKVNAVLMRGVNDHEAASLLRFCLDRGYQLRFIEQMPLDAQHGWRRTDMVTAGEILARLSDGFSLAPDSPVGRGSAPAETFLVDGGPGRVGVIGSVTRPFCGTCDRVRLPELTDQAHPGQPLQGPVDLRPGDIPDSTERGPAAELGRKSKAVMRGLLSGRAQHHPLRQRQPRLRRDHASPQATTAARRFVRSR